MKWWHKVWIWIRWPLVVLVAFYILLVLYRIPAVGEQQKTQDAVARIEAAHITLADVEGSVLPPMPNEEENNATVAGIDKNNNGIRDDIELAIFKLHPDSAKVRAAELQYAMAEQMFLTDVFNTDTWIAVAQQDSRAYACVGKSVPNSNNLNADLQSVKTRINEVQNLVFNTNSRKDAENKAYTFTTSYGDLSGESCDIDLSTLSN